MAPSSRKPLTQRDRNVPIETSDATGAKPTNGLGLTGAKAPEKVVKSRIGKVSKNTNNALSTSDDQALEGEMGTSVNKTEATMIKAKATSSAEDHAEIDDLVAMLSKASLGPAVSVSVPPPPPTRPQTAYQAFAADAWAELKAKEQSLSLKEMSIYVAEQWRNATEEVKAEYENRTSEARARYEEEKRAHATRLAVIEEERAAVAFLQKKELQEEAMAFFLKHRGTIGESKEGKKVDKPKPKAARTAYIMYVALRREEMTGNGEKPSLSEVSGVASEEWKKLQSSRKKKDKQVVEKCMSLAQDDQLRYQKELEEYEASIAEDKKAKAAEDEDFRKRALEVYRAEEQVKKDAESYRKLMAERSAHEKEERKAARAAKAAEKAAKELGPKRARNAYMFFFAEKSKEAETRALAEREEKNVAAVVSEMWKSCNDEERSRFTEMAAEDKARYDKEVKEVASKSE